MQISFKDFTINAVCATLPFVLKYEDFGPLEKISGTAFFYLYDKYYAYECVISLFRLAPGPTSRPVGSPP